MHATATEVTGTGCDAGLSPEARQSQSRASWAVVVWGLAFLASTLALSLGPNLPPALRWVLAAVPSLLGVVAILAYVLFLRDTDELQRKIQVEALALGFGAGLVAMQGYRLLERAGAPRIDVNDLGIVMVLVFAAGIYSGRRRYS